MGNDCESKETIISVFFIAFEDRLQVSTITTVSLAVKAVHESV